MKIGDLGVDLLFDWAVRLISPLRMINDQMASDEPVQKFMARTWSCPLALLLVVDLAAVALAGLNVIENKEVVAAITLANSLQLFVAPLLVWTFLRMLRAPTSIETVVIAYTPTILFAPVFRAIGVGSAAAQYHLAQILLANNDTVQKAIEYVIRNPVKIGEFLPKPIPVISPVIITVTGAGALLLTVLACEAIAWFSRHDRLRVYLAVCTAVTLATIPQAIFHAAQMTLTVKIASLPTN